MLLDVFLCLDLRLCSLLSAYPSSSLEPFPEHVNTFEHPCAFSKVRWQVVRVMEGSCKAEERDDRGQFVQEEEGDYVGDGSIGESSCVPVQEFR